MYCASSRRKLHRITPVRIADLTFFRDSSLDFSIVSFKSSYDWYRICSERWMAG